MLSSCLSLELPLESRLNDYISCLFSLSKVQFVLPSVHEVEIPDAVQYIL